MSHCSREQTKAKILQCPGHRGLNVIVLDQSSQTGLENDCMNEHNAAVRGDSVLGSKEDLRRMGR